MLCGPGKDVVLQPPSQKRENNEVYRSHIITDNMPTVTDSGPAEDLRTRGNLT